MMRIVRWLPLLAAANTFAHDLWIEPATFCPAAGQIVGVRLRVGQDLIGDPVPRDPALVREFVFEDAEGRKPLIGRTGSDPAGFLRIGAAGLQVIGYFSNPSPVELPAAKFNQYLKEEGLDSVLAQRASRNQSGAAAREIFTRCAKSLVSSGTPGAGQNDRALGFPLELVAERNPYTMRATEELPVRLTYEKRPLAGALVIAMNKQDPSARLTARSDSAGRVRFRMQPRGMWMIKAVYMIPAPSGSNAEWASYWASLTFELRAEGK